MQILFLFTKVLILKFVQNIYEMTCAHGALSINYEEEIRTSLRIPTNPSVEIIYKWHKNLKKKIQKN